jgi:hypothetical protein
MVPIQVIRWYRMQCYDGTDSCAIVVPIRRYCHRIIDKCKGNGATDNQRPFNAHLHAYVVYKKIYGMQAAVVLNLMHKGKDLLAFMK